MKTNNNLYEFTISLGNLTLAWRKARKGKTAKEYIIEFEKELEKNLLLLHEELRSKTYKPRPLQTFILRDPKTRKISKSDFRDRIIHHAIVNVLEPIYEKLFIYDCCANRKGKGTLFALKRFDIFKRKVTKNHKLERSYCLKADIKHYFEEIDRVVLLGLLQRRVHDEQLIWLVQQILDTVPHAIGGGANEVRR
jgi:retron-type reverse transcriptase